VELKVGNGMRWKYFMYRDGYVDPEDFVLFFSAAA